MKNQLIIILTVLIISLISFSNLHAQAAEDAPTQHEIEQAQMDKVEAAEQEAERLVNEERIKEIEAFDAERIQADQAIINRAHAKQKPENEPTKAQITPSIETQTATQKTARKKRKSNSKRKRQ